MGMTESNSYFGTDGSTHPGWRSQSSDGKYRVWTFSNNAANRGYEWSCQIEGKQAVLKVWHEARTKDELIEKYGIRHDRCGAFRKMSLTYDGRVVLENLVMGGDGCEQIQSTKSAVYFGRTHLLPKGLTEGLALRVKAIREETRRANEITTYVDRLYVDATATTVFYRRQKI